MKKSVVHLLAVAFTALTLVGCGFTMSTYQGNGFTMKYPQGWTVGVADQNKLVTISYINAATYSIDGVISVSGQTIGSNDVPTVIASNEASLRANTLNQNFATEKVTISGQSTVLWKYEQARDNQKISYRQAMFAQNGILYTLTGVATGAVTSVSDLDDAIKSFAITAK